jgi:hypothetical protein
MEEAEEEEERCMEELEEEQCMEELEEEEDSPPLSRTGLQPGLSGTPPPLQPRVLRCLQVLSLPLSLLALQYTEY